MELMQAIRTRRSVRAYDGEPVDRKAIEAMLDAAIHAPTAMNLQPWAFGVVQDKDELRGISARAKAHLLTLQDQLPWLEQYREHLEKPETDIFYNASALVVIYGDSRTGTIESDCSLAAENLMLAACDLGLGSCWIGFACWYLNLPEVKKEFGVPEEFSAVVPIVVGNPVSDEPPTEKNPPVVMYWR